MKIYEVSRSNDWIRFTGNKNILSIYYKFIGDFGYSNIGVVVGAKSQNQATQIRKILNKSLKIIMSLLI